MLPFFRESSKRKFKMKVVEMMDILIYFGGINTLKYRSL